jgi:flavin reductase (DIM6/NTAB) family NADH-FMN oxidoreductase RutF
MMCVLIHCGADLIIGEVVMYHINEDVYFEDSKIDFNQLKPVARLADTITCKIHIIMILDV